MGVRDETEAFEMGQGCWGWDGGVCDGTGVFVMGQMCW